VTWTAIGFGGYLVVLALLAVRAARTAGKSHAEYFLAGRSLGAWVVALSAVASGRSAWLLLGMSFLAYGSGVAAVWFLPGYIVAELLLFVSAGRRLREATGTAGDVTVGDYFASRFPLWSRPLQIVYAITVLVFITPYVGAQLFAGGKGLHAAFDGLDKGLGITLTAVIVLAYVVVGGFRAVSWTDVVQVVLMLLALVVLPAVAVFQMGGIGNVLDALGERSDPLWKGWPFVITGLAVGFGSPGNPHILVRYMSVRKSSDLRRAAVVGTTWNVIMGWGALWIGLAAHAHFGAGAVTKETAFPQLAEAFLHPLLFGLVMAALLAAIMSTVDSQVLVAASAISRDLRRALRRPVADPRAAAREGRIVSAALILLATVLAYVMLGAEGAAEKGHIAGVINKLVLFAWGGLGAAIGPALLLSLYYRRMNGVAALAAMLTGGITACVWKGLVIPRMKALDAPPAWWPWISYELTVAFPLALLAGWLVARMSPIARRPDPRTDS
jgi:SSS family solute:Na+ symporter